MHCLLITVAAVAGLAVCVRAADTTQPAATQPSTTQPSSAQPAAAQPAATQAFSSQYQTASYGIGYDLGRNIKESKVALDGELIMQGLKDCLAGTTSKVSPEQFQAAMQMVQGEMQANAAAANKVAGDSAAKDGDAFRAENAKKPGVKVTASGLQIEIVTEGTGPSPTAADKVKVHYTGKLIDGKVFDSSIERGQPISFPLNGVIPGWTEGLQLMKVGGKAMLVIPPALGYGVSGSPPTIPPNSTLVFEVQLLGIEK